MRDRPTRHQVEWVAAGLGRAAADHGVAVSVDYLHRLAADGLARSAELGVTALAGGVVFHTHPAGSADRPIVLGYANRDRQWARDGKASERLGLEPADPSALNREEVGL